MNVSIELLPRKQRAELLGWVVDALQVGILVIGRQKQIVLVNEWVLERSGLREIEVCNRPLIQIFPEIAGTRVDQAIEFALKNNCPALVSQSLNRAPFPFFKNQGKSGTPERIQQAIQILPTHFENDAGEIETFVLVQIVDVTPNVHRENMLRAQADQMRRHSNTDSLTGIANRRRFNEYLDTELKRAQRTGRPLSLVLFDIDHFKNYNDQFGHQAGDQCLVRVVEEAARALRRPADLLARYGGEEFALILPETDQQGAHRLAEEIRQRLARLDIRHADSAPVDSVTLSLGIATHNPANEPDIDRLIADCDAALYRAKTEGRNRSVLA